MLSIFLTPFKPLISEVLRFLLQWQRDHKCLLEIVYVNTKVINNPFCLRKTFYFKNNLADKPSREIYHDEPAVSNTFLRMVEKDLNLRFTLDSCR